MTRPITAGKESILDAKADPVPGPGTTAVPIRARDIPQSCSPLRYMSHVHTRQSLPHLEQGGGLPSPWGGHVSRQHPCSQLHALMQSCSSGVVSRIPASASLRCRQASTKLQRLLSLLLGGRRRPGGLWKTRPLIVPELSRTETKSQMYFKLSWSRGNFYETVFLGHTFKDVPLDSRYHICTIAS